MSYPKPPIPYVGYSDLYFATEQQVRSSASLGNYDRGEISVTPGRITFRGMNVMVECPNVSGIRQVRKSFPWLVYIPVVIVAALIAFATSPISLPWRQPLPYILGVILSCLAVVYGREYWIEVVYQDDGIQRRAYFRRSPSIFLLARRRNHRLLNELRHALNVPPQ